MRKPLIEIEVDGIQLPNLEEQSAKNKENNKSNKSTGNLDFLNKGEHTIDNSYGSLEGQLENPKKSNSTDANQLTNNLSTGVVYSELLSDEEIHRFLNEAEKANMNFTDNWSSNFSIIAGGLGELKDHEIEQFLNDFLLECTTYIDNFS